MVLLRVLVPISTFSMRLQAESQNIRANVLLNRKKEKVNRKYAPPVDRRRQLSPGFLEDALDEVCSQNIVFLSVIVVFICTCICYDFFYTNL